MAEKLKRAVIKEELIAITGNYVDAIILNQFLYWAERINDFDAYQKEEQKIAEKSGMKFNPEFTHGWIFKSANSLSDETMLGLSISNMRKHIRSLVAAGFIQERKNPKYKWDKTMQYRVNLNAIQSALHKAGYTLEGYRMNETFSNLKSPSSKTEDQLSQNRTAIPKTTAETTTETTNKASGRASAFTDATTFSDELVGFVDCIYPQIYQQYIGGEHPRLKTGQRLKVLVILNSFLTRYGESVESLETAAEIFLSDPDHGDGNINLFANPEIIRIRLVRAGFTEFVDLNA